MQIDEIIKLIETVSKNDVDSLNYATDSEKIVIKKNVIIAGKISINMEEIESATVKIDRISAFKYDRFLDIVTKDKKRVKLRLNIGNDVLFLKLIQNYTGDKLVIS